MATKTTNYQFVKPEGTDALLPDAFNDDLDAIDEELKNVNDAVKAVADKVGNADTTLEEVATKLFEHDTKLTEHDTSIAELNKKIEELGNTPHNVATAEEIYAVLGIGANVFGVMWDSSNSDTALTRLTKFTDPYGLVTQDINTEPVPAVGTGEGSSPFDSFAPWSGMKVCNLDTDGTVTAWQGDDAFSYDAPYAMVYIPEFWFAVKTDGEKKFFYVSDAPRNGMTKHPGSGKYIGRYFMEYDAANSTTGSALSYHGVTSIHTNAKSIGEKWHSYDFATHCALVFLYLIEYADWNCRGKIGVGDLDSGYSTGATDSMEYHTGAYTRTDIDNTVIQYRHIESWGGNKNQFVDGFNIKEYAAYYCINPNEYELSTTDGYIELGELPYLNGAIKDITITENGLFVPKTVTRLTDDELDEYVAGRYITDDSSEWRGLAIGYHSIMSFDTSNVVGHISSGLAGRLECEP